MARIFFDFFHLRCHESDKKRILNLLEKVSRFEFLYLSGRTLNNGARTLWSGVRLFLRNSHMSLSRARDKRITFSSITRPSSNCGHRENHEHGTSKIFRNIAGHPGVTKCCNSYEKNMLN